MKLALALAACTAALGCSRADDKQCRADADELVRWLGTLNLEPQVVQVGRERLVSRSDLGSLRPGYRPVVMIGADTTSYQGHAIRDVDDLADRLSATQRKLADDLARGRSEGGPPEPRQLYLLIDEAVTWERVVAVAAIAHRVGFTAPSFLFTPPPGPDQRPPRSAYDDRLDAVERDIAAGKTTPSSQGEPLLARCPSVTRLYGELGMMQTGNKADELVRGIGPALVDCGCKVDLPSLRSSLWRMLHNATPVRELRVELGPDAPPIALPAITPWREASKRLTPTTRRTWLAVGS